MPKNHESHERSALKLFLSELFEEHGLEADLINGMSDAQILKQLQIIKEESEDMEDLNKRISEMETALKTIVDSINSKDKSNDEQADDPLKVENEALKKRLERVEKELSHFKQQDARVLAIKRTLPDIRGLDAKPLEEIENLFNSLKAKGKIEDEKHIKDFELQKLREQNKELTDQRKKVLYKAFVEAREDTAVPLNYEAIDRLIEEWKSADASLDDFGVCKRLEKEIGQALALRIEPKPEVSDKYGVPVVNLTIREEEVIQDTSSIFELYNKPQGGEA